MRTGGDSGREYEKTPSAMPGVFFGIENAPGFRVPGASKSFCRSADEQSKDDDHEGDHRKDGTGGVNGRTHPTCDNERLSLVSFRFTAPSPAGFEKSHEGKEQNDSSYPPPDIFRYEIYDRLHDIWVLCFLYCCDMYWWRHQVTKWHIACILNAR